jgi:hypothetical protein
MLVAAVVALIRLLEQEVLAALAEVGRAAQIPMERAVQSIPEAAAEVQEVTPHPVQVAQAVQVSSLLLIQILMPQQHQPQDHQQ